MEGAPLTFGVTRPTVVLPPGLEGGELLCVLVHEGVHARRRDNLWHYAMALALAVHWWNPAVWWMARLLRRDVELSCDRAALEKLGTDKRVQYANALVTLATQTEGPAFCQPFGPKATEERIRSIMKFKKTSLIGVILTLALVVGVTVAFASEPKEKTPDEDSTTYSAPSGFSWGSTSDPETGALKTLTISLDYLEKSLVELMDKGQITQAEASRILPLAQAAAGDSDRLEWEFEPDSGLYSPGEEAPGLGLCYKDKYGMLQPIEPAVVVGIYIFPAEGVDRPSYVGADEDLVWLPDVEGTQGIQSDYPAVDPDDVDLSRMRERLAQQVADGEITQAYMDARLAQVEDMLEAARRGEAKLFMTEDGDVFSGGVGALYRRDADGNLIPASSCTLESGQPTGQDVRPPEFAEDADASNPVFTPDYTSGPDEQESETRPAGSRYQIIYNVNVINGSVVSRKTADLITPEEYEALMNQWVAQGINDRTQADYSIRYFQRDYQRLQKGEIDWFGFNYCVDGHIIPAWFVSDRVEAGYPRNSKGETYGPNVPEVYGSSPDLEAAFGSNGEEGYIRQSDMPGANVKNPEEALAYMEWLKTQPPTIPIPLYDCEGNVIGQFSAGNAESGKAPASSAGTAAWPVCHMDGCAIEGQHDHNGVTYCGGEAHHSDTCDGGCIYHAQYLVENDTHHGEEHHSSGHH